MVQRLAPDGVEYEESSGNVFADLGLPNPKERMAKALLSIAIERAIKDKGLKDTQSVSENCLSGLCFRY